MLTGQSQPDRLTGGRNRSIAAAVERSLAQLSLESGDYKRRLLLDPSSEGILDVPESDLLATARQISPDWHVRIHAAFQRFADEAGAKTVNVANDANLDTIIDLFRSARQLGLKGITVFRDGCLDECFAVPKVGSEWT
jgi:ribonucleoside-diphosphate reductase alpha chain